MPNSRYARLAPVLWSINAMVEQASAYLSEELQLHRRDLISRLDRKIRERGTPMAGNVLRARRERRARDHEHSQKGVLKPPTKHLSTRLRAR